MTITSRPAEAWQAGLEDRARAWLREMHVDPPTIRQLAAVVELLREECVRARAKLLAQLANGTHGEELQRPALQQAARDQAATIVELRATITARDSLIRNLQVQLGMKLTPAVARVAADTAPRQRPEP